MRRLVIAAVASTIFLAACGEGAAENGTTADPGSATSLAEQEATTTGVVSSTGASVVDGDDPCGLVSAETVAEVFGGTSAAGAPGPARNCSFTIEAGVAPSVEVFYYGSASDWEGVKAGYEENRGGVTEVAGVGDEAYNPGDVGPYELVVRSGDAIFAVAVQSGGGGPEVEEAIVVLAGEIAGG